MKHCMGTKIGVVGQGDGVPKASSQQAAADSRGSEPACLQTPFPRRWHMQG